jgi:hypothetical protein
MQQNDGATPFAKLASCALSKLFHRDRGAIAAHQVRNLAMTYMMAVTAFDGDRKASIGEAPQRVQIV